MLKSKFCAISISLAWRPPDWPAPPEVNASLTRTIGSTDEGSVALVVLLNSNRSSLKTFLPITPVLRTRTMSDVKSVA